VTVPAAVAEAAARAQRELSGRVLAITLRSVRDLDIAEEATADAFLLALQTWPERGVPASVEAWLVTAAKRRAIDRIRSAQAARRALLRTAGGLRGVAEAADVSTEVGVIGDEDLRLVVLCCDPRIAVDDQIALTLRLACGVPTPAVAAAFLVPEPTMAARLTRAKKKLAAAGPALDLPDDATVDARLPAVRRVVHLAFTLGHTAGAGESLTDDDLADRAQYLATALQALRPGDAEFRGLLALILLTRARAGGRWDDAGRQVLLPDADRTRWDGELIRRGLALAEGALAGPEPGPMALQAAIAAAHARATSSESTDWARIVASYGLLLQREPSATVAVGRSIAIGHLRGPAQGLADLDEVLALGGLDRYPYAFGARALLLERLGRSEEARAEWTRAAAVARTAAERQYFTARSDAWLVTATDGATVAGVGAAGQDGHTANIAQSRSRS
jgi:RNA polymerase sigma-70 factor (ECF subfamily)